MTTPSPHAMLIDNVVPAVPLLSTVWATTPTPKMINTNVPRNSASISRPTPFDISPPGNAAIVDSSAMAYILALDQGTTSSRAIVFDHAGTIKSVAQKEFRQIFPKAGWVEHDPEELWASQVGVAVEALGRAGLRPDDIAALGITNQRETTVVWDRETGHPIHNAIVWQDRRTADFCERLKNDGAAATVQQKTGLIIDAYFSATKIRWILDNVEGARARAQAGKLAFGTIDSWLIWKLTDGCQHVT